MTMMADSMIKTYSELIELESYKKRFEYLKLNGEISKQTFGYDRYLNQYFYKTPEWRHVRNQVILRDNACDLAMNGYEIVGKIIIHHMNPIRIEDILYRREEIFDPEYLICVSHETHNAIHYGDSSLLIDTPIVRTPNDTCPWKGQKCKIYI